MVITSGMTMMRTTMIDDLLFAATAVGALILVALAWIGAIATVELVRFFFRR